MLVGIAPHTMTTAHHPLAASPFTAIDQPMTPASPPPRSHPASQDRLKELRQDTARSPGKLPTLSDIAARLNVERDHATEDGASLSPIKSSSSEGRPRLDLTGRLLPTTLPNNAASDALQATTLTLGPAGLSKLNLAASGQVSGTQLTSGSCSPTKRLAASGLPSLDEIRERMAKKGLHSDNASNNDKENASPTRLPASSSLLKFGAGPFEVEPKKRRASPPPAIIIPGKDAVVKDESIMRFGASTPLSGKPPSPSRTNSSESPKSERAVLRPGTGSLPPTPSSTVSNFALSVTSPQPKTHPLQHMWTLYFDSKTFNPSAALTTPTSATFPDGGQSSGSETPATPTVSGASWEANLKCLGAYRTVEAFFGTFKTLRRPSQLDKTSNYHIFKDGIKPMWEDPSNAEGGKWTLCFKQNNPGLTDRSWMYLVLGLVGEELDEQDEVTGAVCSLRPRGDRLSLWLRSKNNVDRVNLIGRKLLQLLELEKEPGVTLEFSSNTGAPLEGPSRFISVQNPIMPGTQAPGLNAQRRQSFQGSLTTMGNASSASQPFKHTQRSPSGQNTVSLAQQQQQPPASSSSSSATASSASMRFGGLSPGRSPEQRECHPLPRNPSPSLGSSLGVQLGTSPGKLVSDGASTQPPRVQGPGSRFGPPMSTTGGSALGRTPLGRSTLNPNLPMRV
ncbi:hypothetical protein ACQY0O_008348 [Thecaphora frezii]